MQFIGSRREFDHRFYKTILTLREIRFFLRFKSIYFKIIFAIPYINIPEDK